MCPECLVGAQHSKGEGKNQGSTMIQGEPRVWPKSNILGGINSSPQVCSELSTPQCRGMAKVLTIEHFLVASHETPGKCYQISSRTGLTPVWGTAWELERPWYPAQALLVALEAHVATNSLCTVFCRKMIPSKYFDFWSPENKMCVLVTSASLVSACDISF